MLDNDDADFAILMMGGKGWVALLFALLALVVVIIVAMNESECSQKTCDRGDPVLVEGECRCMEKAH